MGEISEPPANASAVVMAFIQAFSDHDKARARTLITDDFVRIGSDLGWQPMSRAEYLGLWDNYFEPFPDARWDVLALVESSGVVAVNLIESGTFSRPWNLRGRQLQPNHETYHIQAAIFFWVRDNLICRYKYIGSGDWMEKYGSLLERPNDVAFTIPKIFDED